MELRLIMLFSLCIFVIIFGNSSGQTEIDGDDESVYPTTTAGNEKSTKTMSTTYRSWTTTTEAPVKMVTTESVTSTTRSTNSSSVTNSSVASTETKQVSTKKTTTDSTPTDNQIMATTLILSITTAAGFLLWILTLLILCCACCYKRCNLCKDKGSKRSIAPPGPPPTCPAPEPVLRVTPPTDENIYVNPTKKPDGRKQRNHQFLDPGRDPIYDVSPQHGFIKRMPDYEDDISEADTDGISDCGDVFIDDENRPEVNMSSELQNRSTTEVTSTTPDITQPSTVPIANGLPETSILSHTHNNPLFVKELMEKANRKTPEILEDAGLYSDVAIEENVM
ncbi:hypothetical protein HOLleu_13190 [Holothuria leucospilota]|uniref:Uncharacterized protein n=1 Tax=Holothuria leucospilota TaxID=206669 RepID=A0A9Q1CC30_HOLLE|nr:hypothetical protein HOLleu_13190 [Holothuria leucospilota]